MFTNPHVNREIARYRQRDMLAEAEQHRLSQPGSRRSALRQASLAARQLRRAMRAAWPLRRAARTPLGTGQ